MAVKWQLFPQNIVILLVAAVAGIIAGIISKIYSILYSVPNINKTFETFMPKVAANGMIYIIYGAMIAGGVIIGFSIIEILRED